MPMNKQSYYKRILYVDCYKGGQKIANVGFVRLVNGKHTSLQLYIADPQGSEEKQAAICLLVDEKEIVIGEIGLHQGKGEFLITNLETILSREIGDRKEYRELKLQIAPNADTVYRCVLEEGKVVENAVEENLEEPVEILSAEISSPPLQKPEEAMLKVQSDKWKQLTDKLAWTRPFRDERCYLLLDLTDMIILPKQHYRLVENSFLLHGYYNYGHLVLARICRKGMEKYYIGVPGNFYEKEKQVAVLFGFESFESKTVPATEGEFGYYMMGVDI